MYALLLAIIYVAFVSLGLPDSMIGAGWPAMHADLGVPLSAAGLLTMIIAVGTIVSSLLSERLTRRLGTGLVTATSVGMTAAALFGFASADAFWVLCLWAIPYGLGAGAVDAALNNYVALHFAARHMNWLHSFWGVGASISPFIMSFALSSGSGWPSAYLSVGIVQAVLTLALLSTLPLWGRVSTTSLLPDASPGPDASAETDAVGPTAAQDAAPGRGHVPLGVALRTPGVLFVLTAFFAYCGLESTAMLWSASYLVAEHAVSPATAAAFGSLFLLGVTAGRFASGFVADAVGDTVLIRGGFLTVGAGALLIALPVPTSALALTGLVLAGLGSAPIYPAIIHSTPANFGRHRSHAIIGIQMAAAYTGTTLIPPLFGILATWLGMWLLPFFILVFVVLGIVMSERLNRMVALRRTAQASAALPHDAPALPGEPTDG
ncbi:MFS transporter [Sanguibacter sp. A247]|uniref:MFS transporter n=1 Tax=unclassified Sanguibacter TaxID=2645534 RepID=UPI003FD7CCE8